VTTLRDHDSAVTNKQTNNNQSKPDVADDYYYRCSVMQWNIHDSLFFFFNNG
jgi:hypothetical protein